MILADREEVVNREELSPFPAQADPDPPRLRFLAAQVWQELPRSSFGPVLPDRHISDLVLRGVKTRVHIE